MSVDTSILCPSDEDIALYVDNNLDTLSAMLVDEHLNYCPRCYKLVSEARAVLQMMQRDKEIAKDEVREEYQESYRQNADRRQI